MAWIIRPGGRPTEVSDPLVAHARATVEAEGREDDPVIAALKRSMLALDDWLHLYADDMCEMAEVTESERRVGQFGTIAYIADVQQQNRAAIRAWEGRES